MRRRFVFLLVLIIGCGHVASHPNAADEVKALERAWLDAYEQRDVEAMKRIVADGFTITYPNGSVETKEQVVKALAEAKGTSPKFSTEDVAAAVRGNTVVLTGRVITEGQRADGQAYRSASRYTDTYMYLDGRWQVIASHLSQAK